MKFESYSDLFQLKDRVAIVTGGTGILGKHFCAGLAEFGADVVVVDQNAEQTRELAGYLSDTYKQNCIGIECDVADKKSVENLTQQVLKKFGKIHILHNNAATKTKDLDKFFEPTETYSIEEWKEVMSVNLDGMFLVAQSVGAQMAKAKGGVIVQTGSIYGVMAPDQRIYDGSEYNGRPINTPAVYSASKAGVVGLTKYLASYWGADGVRVNTLVPGGVFSGQNDTFVKKYSARIPLGKMAEPKDMVGALLYLVSDAAKYVTGQTLMVDGGLSAW